MKLRDLLIKLNVTQAVRLLTKNGNTKFKGPAMDALTYAHNTDCAYWDITDIDVWHSSTGEIAIGIEKGDYV